MCYNAVIRVCRTCLCNRHVITHRQKARTSEESHLITVGKRSFFFVSCVFVGAANNATLITYFSAAAACVHTYFYRKKNDFVSLVLCLYNVLEFHHSLFFFVFRSFSRFLSCQSTGFKSIVIMNPADVATGRHREICLGSS